MKHVSKLCDAYGPANIGEQVVKLMDRVEGIFTEHFTKNPRQAMAYLKPTRQKVSHSITFLSGKTHSLCELTN